MADSIAGERQTARRWRRRLLNAGLAAWLLGAQVGHAGSVSYSYDALGRLAKAVYNNGSTTTTITYNYDAAGNRTSMVTTTP